MRSSTPKSALESAQLSSESILAISVELAAALPLISRWPSAWFEAQSAEALIALWRAQLSLTPLDEPSVPELSLLTLLERLSAEEARVVVQLTLSHATHRLSLSPHEPPPLARLTSALSVALRGSRALWEAEPQRLEVWLSSEVRSQWRSLEPLISEPDLEPTSEPFSELYDVEWSSPDELVEGEPLPFEDDSFADEELSSSAPSPLELPVELAPPPPAPPAPKVGAAPPALERAREERSEELTPLKKRSRAVRTSAPPPQPSAAPPAPAPAPSAPPTLSAPAPLELPQEAQGLDEAQEGLFGAASTPDEPPPSLDVNLEASAGSAPLPQAPTGVARGSGDVSREAEVDSSSLEEPQPKVEPSRLERWLDDDAGDPGPLERLIERVRFMSRALNATLSLHALPLIHLVDQLWELLSGYIKTIFSGGMRLRSALKISQRRAQGQLATGFERDAQSALALTRSLLCLPSADEPSLHAPPRAEHLLGLALSARAQLDDLKRDLHQLKPGGLKKGLWSALKGYILDLIPNPLSFLKPWWTWAMVTFGLRFKRGEVMSLVEQLARGCEALTRELEREEREGIHDASRRSSAISELQALLSRLQLITLQSHEHARPQAWAPLSLALELERAESSEVLSHPLTALYARLWLLEALQAGAHEASRAEQRALVMTLAETRSLTRSLERLRSRALL